MQVVPSGGQICNQCKWRHLVAQFGTNASGAIWWPNLQQMQEVHVVVKFNPSHGVNFWVRCASGNVSFCFPFYLLKLGFWWDEWLVTRMEKWKLTETTDGGTIYLAQRGINWYPVYYQKLSQQWLFPKFLKYLTCSNFISSSQLLNSVRTLLFIDRICVLLSIPLECWPYLWYAEHVCCMLILFMGKCY